jgi:hypothetical protein
MIKEKQREQIRRNKALRKWFGEEYIIKIAKLSEEDLWEMEGTLRGVTCTVYKELKKEAATALYGILVGTLAE